MWRVIIDGVETTLTYDRYSGNRGYQYLTPGNTASHAFQRQLGTGQHFTCNGHTYYVKGPALGTEA